MAKKEKLVQQIREVRKEKANKVCFDCGEKGPQYVCLPFSTFVCMTCSGLHREFNHRVKSISISDFTEEEVNGIKNGGNEVAQKKWMARYDPKDFPIPDPSQPSVIRTQRIKELIKLKYIDRRWVERDDPKKKKKVAAEPEKKKSKEKKEEKPKKKKVVKEESDEEDGPGSPKPTARNVTLPPMVVRKGSEDDEEVPQKPTKSKSKSVPVPAAVESKSKPKSKKPVQDAQPKKSKPQVQEEVDEEPSPKAQVRSTKSQPQVQKQQPQPQSGGDPLDLLSFSGDEAQTPTPTTNGKPQQDGDDNWADFDGPQSPPVSHAPPKQTYVQPTDHWGGFTTVQPRQPTFIDFTVKSTAPSTPPEKKVEQAQPVINHTQPTPQASGDPFADLMGTGSTPPQTPQLGPTSTHTQPGPTPLSIPSTHSTHPTMPTVTTMPTVPTMPTMPTMPGVQPGVSPYGVTMMQPGVVGVPPQWSQQAQQAAYQAAMYQQQMMYYYMAQQAAAQHAAQQGGVPQTGQQPPTTQTTTQPTTPSVPRASSFDDLVFQ